MVNNHKLKISTKACIKAHKEGRDYTDAYLFAKQLASLTKHPILFNFKAHIVAYRMLLGLSDHKYRKLLKLAVTYGFCRLQGDNLLVLSRSEEKKLFNIKRSTQYEEINKEDLLTYFQVSVLKHNIHQQKQAIIYKVKNLNNGAGLLSIDRNKYSLHNKSINHTITLSCRSIARLFHVSVGSAHVLTKKFENFGLTFIENKVNISIRLYNLYKHTLKLPNARYNKQTGKFYFLGASTVKVSDFYPPVKTKGTSYYNNIYW